MPNSTNIPIPPSLTGDAEHRAIQLHSYLFKLAEQLAMIFNSMEPAAAAHAGSSTGDAFMIREELRRQIADTAALIRKEIAAISLSGLGLRRGSAETGPIAAGEYMDIAVEIEPLAAVPVVVAGLTGGGTNGECHVLADTVGLSGFTVRVTNRSEEEQSYGVAWIAVE